MKRALVEVQVLAPAAFSDVVDGNVHDDAIQPGVKAGAALELVDVLMHLDEGFLNGVESVVFVLEDAHGHRKGSTMIFVEERSKSGRISSLYALYQIIVTLGGGAV